MLVFLTGFMAAGKSRIGRELATLRDCEFTDLDDQIERNAGTSIPEIFAAEGEKGFRRRERQALEAICGLDSRVVATGGGAVQDSGNIERMRSSGTVVWLDPPFEILLARLMKSPTPRPLFQSEEQVRGLYSSRLEAYARCDHRVRIEGSEQARSIARRIERLLDPLS